MAEKTVVNRGEIWRHRTQNYDVEVMQVDPFSYGQALCRILKNSTESYENLSSFEERFERRRGIYDPSLP